MADVKTKTIHVTEYVRKEIALIAAVVRAKGVATYMEDLFKAMITQDKDGKKIPDVKSFVNKDDSNFLATNNRIDTDVLADLRILAAKNGMNTKAYMEATYNWLAEEHKENGRVWIDDTPIDNLPVRRR